MTITLQNLSQDEISKIPGELFSRMEQHFEAFDVDHSHADILPFLGNNPPDNLPAVSHPFLAERFASEIKAQADAQARAQAEAEASRRKQLQAIVTRPMPTVEEMTAQAQAGEVSAKNMEVGIITERRQAQAELDGIEFGQAQITEIRDEVDVRLDVVEAKKFKAKIKGMSAGTDTRNFLLTTSLTSKNKEISRLAHERLREIAG